MNRPTIIAILCICIELLGCASTKVETSGSAMNGSLCQSGPEKISALVYWGPKWRPDQKESALREAAALRGIQDFFANSDCVAKVEIRKLTREQSEGELSDIQILGLVEAAALAPDIVLLIIVRELGPKLIIGIPVIVEGGTEVVLEVKVLDVHASESMADVRTHWQNGGTFVIKGVGSLDQDMSAALRATLIPSASAQ